MSSCLTSNTLIISRPTQQRSGCAPCSIRTSTGCGSGSGIANCPAMGIGKRKRREEVREKIKDYVLYMLGAPSIDLELTDGALDAFVDQALSIFEEWAPRDYFTYQVFNTSPGKSVYKLHPDVGIIRNVYYKEQGTFAFQSSDLNGSIPVEYFYPGGSYASIQGGLIDPNQPIWGRMGEWVLYKQYETMYSRVSSNLGGWEYVDGHEAIKLYPTPCGCYRVIVHYLQKCKDWNEVKQGMQELALAHAMIALGNIRGKYTNPPGPGGGLSLDGESLRSKGWELKDKVQEDLIYRYGDILPIYLG